MSGCGCGRWCVFNCFLIIQFHEFTYSAHQFENVFVFQDIVNILLDTFSVVYFLYIFITFKTHLNIRQKELVKRTVRLPAQHFLFG